MQVLRKAGCAGKMLKCLKRVQVSLQLLFMSDILTASGNKVSNEILSCHPQGDTWSSMRWPNELPIESDFLLWQSAMLSICPSWSNRSKVGKFISQMHKIWKFYWCKTESTLHQVHNNGKTENVFVLGQKPFDFNTCTAKSGEIIIGYDWCNQHKKESIGAYFQLLQAPNPPWLCHHSWMCYNHGGTHGSGGICLYWVG